MHRFNTILTSLFLLLFGGMVKAQDYRLFVPTYHYLQHNAVTTSLNEQSLLLLDYQNFWPEIPSAFNTITLGYHQYIDAVNGAASIGLTRNSEAGGRLTQTSGHFSYAQRLRLTRDSYLAVGLVSTLNHSFRDDLNVIGPAGEDIEGGTGTVASPDFSLGAGYANNAHFIALYYNNVLHAFENSNTHIDLSYKYKYMLRDRFNDNYIAPFAAVMYYPDHQYMMQTVGVSVLYNSVILNVYERGGGRQIMNDLIIGGGYRFDPYTVHYAYAANVNNLSVTTGRNGAHEVTFLVELQYKGKRNKRGAIKCPDI